MQDTLDEKGLLAEGKTAAETHQQRTKWFGRLTTWGGVADVLIFVWIIARFSLDVQLAWLVLSSLFFAVSVIGLSAYTLDTYFRRGLPAARAALYAALPDLPRRPLLYPPRFPRWLGALVVLVFPTLLLLDLSLLLPLSPLWSGIALLLTLVTGVLLAGVTLVGALARANTYERTSLLLLASQWFMLTLGMGAINAALARLLLLLSSFRFDVNVGVNALWIGLTVLASVVFILLLRRLIQPSAANVFRALNAGKYDAALRAAQAFARARAYDGSAGQMPGFVSLHSGDFAGAEALYRRLLTDFQHEVAHISAYLTNIGYALMGQERWDAALPFLEAAARSQPGYPNPITGVAVWYLRQHRDPQRAADLLEQSHPDEPPKINVYMERAQWCQTHGALAVALARLGKDTRANATLDKARAVADPKDMGTQAYLLMDEGLAAAARGELPEARALLERAQMAQRDGATGALIARELARLNAAGA